MPQMAPSNWLSLFLYFIMIFYMFNVITYFFTFYMPTTKKSFMSKKFIHWKW